jgi:hypothetical protein
MIPDFVVRYGEAKFRNGFLIGYVAGMTVGVIIVCMLTDKALPRGSDSIASALNGRR